MGLRSVFDGLYVNQLFQRNEQGETLFYPFGLMGRGYLLPREREEGVRQSMRRLMVASLVVGLVFGLLAVRVVEAAGTVQPVSWLISGTAFLLLLGSIVYFQARLTHGLVAATGSRPQAGEWLKRARRSRPSWTYWASVVSGVLTLLLGAAGTAFSANDGDIIGIAGGAFLFIAGGFLTWDGLKGLIDRSKDTP